MFLRYDLYLQLRLLKFKWSQISAHEIMRNTFGNIHLKSVIMHEEKTKEITTVKEVWICDPNYHEIR